jgi:hypothetical protein
MWLPKPSWSGLVGIDPTAPLESLCHERQIIQTAGGRRAGAGMFSGFDRLRIRSDYLADNDARERASVLPC